MDILTSLFWVLNQQQICSQICPHLWRILTKETCLFMSSSCRQNTTGGWQTKAPVSKHLIIPCKDESFLKKKLCLRWMCLNTALAVKIRQKRKGRHLLLVSEQVTLNLSEKKKSPTEGDNWAGAPRRLAVITDGISVRVDVCNFQGCVQTPVAAFKTRLATSQADRRV